MNTGNAPVIKWQPRRVPLLKQKVERKFCKILDTGTPLFNPWSSIVLVTKKDGSRRFCIKGLMWLSWLLDLQSKVRGFDPQ